MFNEKLRELRNKSGLRQIDVAEKIGISPKTLGHYESGKNEPNIDTIKKLASFYNVSISELFGENPCIKEKESLIDGVIEMLIKNGKFETNSYDSLDDVSKKMLKLAISESVKNKKES